ncbi:hypothetical protein FJT64_000980 [Amphibalanus amphitrite]|uniref:Uncharacterized protein n=1 Tax=Amphibalanus amphitrite TaxID=1232801 RepID=A0A6A4VMW6_AMPAM|nr:hypothetical protein FJT64_000980 [Amphibalanus amphitrite]
MWDSAHLIELAESSARKETSWVSEVKDCISRISQRFTLASGWERLHNAGVELDVKTYRPRSWSDTRFAPYAAAVIKSFTNNLAVMKAAMETQLMAPGYEDESPIRAIKRSSASGRPKVPLRDAVMPARPVVPLRGRWGP